MANNNQAYPATKLTVQIIPLLPTEKPFLPLTHLKNYFMREVDNVEDQLLIQSSRNHRNLMENLWIVYGEEAGVRLALYILNNI